MPSARLGLCATVLVALLWKVAPQVGSETLSPAKVGLLAALSLMAASQNLGRTIHLRKCF